MDALEEVLENLGGFSFTDNISSEITGKKDPTS